ncbi:hypothetical protein A4H97_25735 [Niastella yeongjuensis]|uniref:Uncharacterized protein n=1 Tax=Niastella yeongjuensis TaxID=354355 RepID=A0A1V9F0Z6_9BACT|nr:hypothetical protein [Niastella yeongjuensis]OQP52020.1 hypothetical protein A4H97_25735 [Niastella yeongjuensis]SEP36564.1 hypothetical protein SAMN05660816_05490 [Niastella yeongjuensis]
MKQTKPALLLLAFVIMLTAFSVVTPDLRSKPTIRQTNYYWFDASTNWLGRQATLASEIAFTGYDEGTSNPKTLQEKGWTPGNVSVDSWGVPHPLNGTPDKLLYSHP